MDFFLEMLMLGEFALAYGYFFGVLAQLEDDE